MKLRALFLSMICLFTLALQAQSFEHNTHTTLPCVEKELSITVHHIRDTFNNVEPPTIEQLQPMIDTLNAYFAPICMSFKVCEIKDIENFHYNTLKASEWEELQVTYNQERTINIYLIDISVPWLEDSDIQADFEGLLEPDLLGILIRRNYIAAPDKDIVHNMAHYFGLYDTYRNSGAELVDGSNCETEGDMICDTPADPFIPGAPIQWVELTEGGECRFIYEGKDANDQYYVPHVSNIMSKYPLSCKCSFSYEQYRKMADNWYSSQLKW